MHIRLSRGTDLTQFGVLLNRLARSVMLFIYRHCCFDSHIADTYGLPNKVQQTSLSDYITKVAQ